MGLTIDMSPTAMLLIEEGREEGIEKEKIVIAKNLLKTGMDSKTIEIVTGLSQEKIKKIKRLK